MMPADGLPPPDNPDTFQPPSAEELSLMLPQFEISHLIAVGGMGAVYAGVQKTLDRPVALKILPPEAARDSSAIDRFRTEGRAMARLTHQNIPAVYDFDVQGGYCYMAMEFVDGWNVHQMIQMGEMTPEKAINLLGQVCDALTFAHQCGIMHGDIKPSNLLVNQQGVLKLADFGLARLLDQAGRGEGEWAPMGTPEYAAPELWDPHGRMDERSDLYSLGAVFYEMLTGAPPRGEFQLPAAALRLDRRVDAIIDGCMKADPAHRYQTAAQVRQQLDAITAPKPAAPKGPPPVKILRPGPVRRPGSSRHRASQGTDLSPLLWILLVAAVVAGVIYVVRRPPPDGPVTEKPRHELSPSPVPR